MRSTNPIVRNALAANMSAQGALTAIEMEIGLPDSDAENLLDQYGELIRRNLGDRVYQDLCRRIADNAVATRL